MSRHHVTVLLRSLILSFFLFIFIKFHLCPLVAKTFNFVTVLRLFVSLTVLFHLFDCFITFAWNWIECVHLPFFFCFHWIFLERIKETIAFRLWQMCTLKHFYEPSFASLVLFFFALCFSFQLEMNLISFCRLHKHSKHWIIDAIFKSQTQTDYLMK